MMRGTVVLGIVMCGIAVGCRTDEASSDSNEDHPSSDPVCGGRGKPVALEELVRIFRANGITLDVNQRKCEEHEPTEPDATNAGPRALVRNDAVWEKEGDVLCEVGSLGDRRQIVATKHSTDDETNLRVLNILCTVYPSDQASEAAQVAQVKNALEAVVRNTPPTD